MLCLATYAMGTRFELVLDGEDEPRLRAAGEEAFDVIHEWHARLNRFAQDSQLSFINRTAPLRPVRTDVDLFQLLRFCGDIWQQSGGAFDPTVALALDSFRASKEPAPQHIGMVHVLLDPETLSVRYTHPQLALDLGGIAKGFALDHAARVLRDSGIPTALMHGGTSSIVAIGAPPGRTGWRVRIDSAGTPVFCTLRDMHLSVSCASSEATRSHILDPRAGRFIPEDRTACVIAPSGVMAEAWSTALCVLGHRPAQLVSVTTALHDQGRGWRIEGDPNYLFDDPGVSEAPALEVA